MTKCLAERTVKEQLKTKTLIRFEGMSHPGVEGIKIPDVMGHILSGVSRQDMHVLTSLPPLYSVNGHIM